jgi:CheY-like chemotaxis protein
MTPATVLLIDDDLHIIQMMREALELDGYRVITGFDGQMALNLARAHQPNLIIMDVNMPMTNGLKALEFLRKIPETARIPIIFVSGEQSGSVYPAIEAAQRVAFLKKPIGIDDLLSMTQQFVQRYKAPAV